MRILFGITALAALTAASTASAKPELSDAAYLQAARCVGLASSKNLGTADPKAMQTWFQSASNAKPQFLVDQADDARQLAKSEADHANDRTKPMLQAELSGQCASFGG
jgi:hypothetical protein